MAYLTGQTEQGNCSNVHWVNGVLECEPELPERIVRCGKTNTWHMWHARAEGKVGEKIRILLHWPKFDPELVPEEIRNAANYEIEWDSFIRPAQDVVFMSTDRVHWTRIEDVKMVEHSLYWETELPADTCYFTVSLYYTPENYRDLIRTLAESPYTKQETIGRDECGDELYAFTVSDFSVPDTEKKGIFLIGTQHCSEFNGAHLCDFMMRYLNGDSAEAAQLRTKYQYYFVPVASISSWRQGLDVHSSGLNPNRDWVKQELPTTKAISEWMKTLKPVPDMLLDIHSGLANYGNWETCQAIGVFPDLTAEQLAEQKRFVDFVYETCDFLPTRRYWDDFGANPDCFDGFGYQYGQVHCFEISHYAMYDRTAGRHFPIDQAGIKRFAEQLPNTIDLFFTQKG